MEFVCEGVLAEKLFLKLNRVKTEKEVDINPEFQRQVRKPIGHPEVCFVVLSVKITSTEKYPKPFDVEVDTVGKYRINPEMTATEEREFVAAATQQLYPYLRASVTNLTASAGVAPLNLPILTGPMFPEDQENKS